MILAAAVLFAVLIGLLRGGSLRRLGDLPLRWGWIALVALALQLYLAYFPEPVGQGLLSPQVGILAFSNLLILAVIWQNRRLPGIWLIGAGLLANLTVMLLNGGYMPITSEALTQVGHARNIVSPETGSRVRATKDIVLPREATNLWWLSDIFILPPPFPIPSVFSLGDLFIALGAFWLIQQTMVVKKLNPSEIS
ncbi:MAG: DUF5317 domain-containing protein [Chloroflexi bacterium]|nr:DUF5317 domain-containing protein [Chloroflexota bacterium]